MKKFLAIYMGTEAAMSKWQNLTEDEIKKQQEKGMNSWLSWGTKYQSAIADVGSPLGKTKKVNPKGITDIKNAMTGYTIIEAESHEAAAKMFLEHPHFSIFPGDSVEIMECLPLPEN
jgi:hypothetical protein